jgi:hypothetical protein
MNQFIRYDGQILVADDFQLPDGKKLSDLSGLSTLLEGIQAYAGFNEGAGSKVLDLTRQIAAGIWQGTLGSQWGNGIWLGGGVFNGTDNYIDFGTPNLGFSGNNPFAISLWINPTGAIDSNPLFDYGQAVAGKRIGLIYLADYTIRSSHFSNDHDFSTALDQTAWNHIVLTYDGITEQLYKNGAFAEEWNPTPLSLGAGDPMFIGTQIDNIGGKVITGTADEFALFTRNVTADEVALLFDAGKSLPYPFIG